MRTIIYVDNSDIAPIPLPTGVMKSLRIGSTITVDDVEYTVWYIEENEKVRKVRVER